MSNDGGIEGERQISPTASTKKPFVSRKQMTLGVCGVTALVVGWAFWRGQPAAEQPKGPQQQRIAAEVSYDPPKMPAPTPNVEKVSMPLIPPPPAFFQHPAQAVQQAIRHESHHPEPNMISYPTTNPPSRQGGGSDDPASSETHVAYKAALIGGDKAGPIGDQTFVLMPGVIGCVLDTAIDSTLPGPVQCHLEGDVKSRTGVTLLDRGTTITGQYKNETHTGQGRLFTEADLIATPQGCMVQTAAPMTDSLGRNGLDGSVDNHYLSRFGGGVLMALAESGLGILQSALSHGGNTYISFQSGGMSSLAQEILRSQIDQPPTITKNQGDRIGIFFLKPIDFSSCYQLRTVGQ